MGFPRVKTLAGPPALRDRLDDLGLDLPVDDAVLAAPASPLAAPLALPGGLTAPNRFAVQPMEGWDAAPDGTPSSRTVRRWRRFGSSGAGLVWGGEAVAVHADARANPNQLVLSDTTAAAISTLRAELVAAADHAGHERPVVGLQLTHSGRWSRPHGDPRPRTAFRHPLLDRRVAAGNHTVMSDEEVGDVVTAFGRAASLAAGAGFDFVDIKHCHGYLLHEFLAARHRVGLYGGARLDQRTRLLREVLTAVRGAAPGLVVGVRLSVLDAVPHRAGPDGRGVPEVPVASYADGFGLDLAEPLAVVGLLVEHDVRLVNVTAGSPYYCPHVQRPAAFPPSDGYLPPEDPLAGVARLLHAAREVNRAVPAAVVVSSGWSYLQEFVGHVAQPCVAAGWFDAVGLGRVMLPYPDLPADVLAGRPLDSSRLCRTFSDCTTAPRNGLASGCYPLDPYYRDSADRAELLRIKRAVRAERS